MNNEYIFGNFKFNVKIELNKIIEKKLNGNKYHKITINDMGLTDYYKTILCESHNLIEKLNELLKEAEIWANSNLYNDNDTYEVKLLKSIGFK